MFKRILIAGLVASMAAVSLAGGQYGSAQAANPFYVRAGIFLPNDSDIQDFVNENGLGIALGYELQSQSFLSRDLGRASVELDYWSVSGNSNDVTSWGLWYMERVPFSQPIRGQGTFYGGLGAGFVFNDIDAGGTGVDNSRFAFLALLGYDFNENFFLEGQYRWAGELEGVNMDGISIMVGYRF